MLGSRHVEGMDPRTRHQGLKLPRAERAIVSAEHIERAILVLRGHNVMLDSDLAGLYEVETRALIQAVKRNIDRFPDDFMFQLGPDEAALLRSQSVILKTGRGRPVPGCPTRRVEAIGCVTQSRIRKSPTLSVSTPQHRRSELIRRSSYERISPFGGGTSACVRVIANATGETPSKPVPYLDATPALARTGMSRTSTRLPKTVAIRCNMESECPW